MPFELGLDFGCRRYGGHPFSEKVILILEEQSYRYRAAISDLAGSDIEAHEGESDVAFRKVRNWLISHNSELPRDSASSVFAEYEDFFEWHYKCQLSKGFSEQDIQDYPISELLDQMFVWVHSDKPRG